MTPPAAQLWKYPTVAALSVHLAGGPRETVLVKPPQLDVDSVMQSEGMSQDESERLIDDAFEQLT